MIRSGTTCFNGMCFFPDTVAAVSLAAGICACIGSIAIDFSSAWAANRWEYRDQVLAVHEPFRGDDLINTAFAPHAPHTVSDEALQKILPYSDEPEIPIHIHVHETQDEIDHGMAQHNYRPLHRLATLGLLRPNLIAMHMTHLNHDEVVHFGSTGARRALPAIQYETRQRLFFAAAAAG